MLHHEDEHALDSILTGREVERLLRTKLGGYDKTSLDPKHYPYDAVVLAAARAARLDEGVKGGIIPQSNTTRVYQFLDAIGHKTLAAQFPSQLTPLLPKKPQIR